MSMAVAEQQIAIIVQARMGSSRLPGKVLADVEGRPLLEHLLRRAARSRLADDLVVATSTEREDDAIVDCCKSIGVSVLRGSRDDCLGRYYDVASTVEADLIVRLTGDNPLVDPTIIDRLIHFHATHDLDYAAASLPHQRTLPIGLDVEAFTFQALEIAHLYSTRLSEREHVTFYMWKNPDRFACGVMDHPHDASRHRLTVDYAEDLEVVRRILKAEALAQRTLDADELVAWLDEHPDVAAINSGIQPYQGWEASLARDREAGFDG